MCNVARYAAVGVCTDAETMYSVYVENKTTISWITTVIAPTTLKASAAVKIATPIF